MSAQLTWAKRLKKEGGFGYRGINAENGNSS